MVNNHRQSRSISFGCVDIRRPFSNFNFVERHFQAKAAAIRRLFSQARSYRGRTLVIEDIPAAGIIGDENSEIAHRYPTHKMAGLKRLTFWKPHFSSQRDLRDLDTEDLLGYAILKRDTVPTHNVDRWHVFESTFVKYPHTHNYVHGAKTYRLRIGPHEFSVTGVLYCQQNELNKACAQVALRSLCSMHIDDTKIPFARINRLAESASGAFDPAKGLQAKQIQAVLRGLGIAFTDVDYTLLDAKDRASLPYQKFLYAGVESGAGAMLGFKLAGQASCRTSHHSVLWAHLQSGRVGAKCRSSLFPRRRTDSVSSE